MIGQKMRSITSADRGTLFLFAFAIIGLAIITYQYLQAWDIGYSSDTALIGLMANSILGRGERPIFVWSVGYQGMLLEAYATAIFFAIFGSNGVTLNFASTMYLWLALGVWSVVFTRAFGARAAALTLVATVFSLPLFYHVCMRAMPNFSEAMLLGGLLFLVFDHARIQFEQRQLVNGSLLLLLGFLGGFALYTFAITIYYLAAIGGTLMLVYYQEPFRMGGMDFVLNFVAPWQQRSRKFDQFLGRTISPVLGKVLTATSILGWFGVVAGVLVCFYAPDKFTFDGRIVKYNGLGVIFGGAMLIVGPRIMIDLVRDLRASQRLRRMAGLIMIGGVLGHSPALYYKLTGGQTYKTASPWGNWSNVVTRLGFYREFHSEVMHVGPFWTWWISFYFLGSVLTFMGLWVLAVRTFVQTSARSIPPIIIYGFFAIIVFCIFILSKTVSDLTSLRYLTLTVPMFALMLGVATDLAWKGWPRAKLGFIVSFFGVVALGTQSILRDLSTAQNSPFQTIAKEMDARGLRYAYADYWLAYSTTFLTGERLVLEPVYSNYSPHYGPLIAAEKRVAYVDYAPGLYPPKNGEVEIYHRKFTVTEEAEIFPSIMMRVLEAK